MIRPQNLVISLPKAQFKNLLQIISVKSPTPRSFSPSYAQSWIVVEYSPINRYQNPIPPTNTHRQIRPAPNQPRRPPTDIAHHALRLHRALRAAKIGHDAQVADGEGVGVEIVVVETLGEPDCLLGGRLRGGGEGAGAEGGVVAEGEDGCHCC